jgi:cation:H+ antiporter
MWTRRELHAARRETGTRLKMNDFAILILGIVCAGAGGEFFVRGSVGLARWARISPGIIGATVAAFATSSPELSVAVNSALAGRPQIALGDSLGSNVANVALILALALVISGIQSPRDTVKRDFPIAMLAPLFTGFLVIDGVVSRLDGCLMIACFLVWLVAMVVEARKQRSAAGQILGAHRGCLSILASIVGMGLLVAAGNLIVTGAKGIAVTYHLDAFVIGATLVAFGTSAPELATAVISKLRGHDEVGLGTILGSNIFNGLLVVAVAAVIHPITVNRSEVFAALFVGVLALAITFPPRNGFIHRWRGGLLLVLYAVYLIVVFQRGGGH